MYKKRRYEVRGVDSQGLTIRLAFVSLKTANSVANGLCESYVLDTTNNTYVGGNSQFVKNLLAERECQNRATAIGAANAETNMKLNVS